MLFTIIQLELESTISFTVSSIPTKTLIINKAIIWNHAQSVLYELSITKRIAQEWFLPSLQSLSILKTSEPWLLINALRLATTESQSFSFQSTKSHLSFHVAHPHEDERVKNKHRMDNQVEF